MSFKKYMNNPSIKYVCDEYGHTWEFYGNKLTRTIGLVEKKHCNNCLAMRIEHRWPIVEFKKVIEWKSKVIIIEDPRIES